MGISGDGSAVGMGSAHRRRDTAGSPGTSLHRQARFICAVSHIWPDAGAVLGRARSVEITDSGGVPGAAPGCRYQPRAAYGKRPPAAPAV